MILKERFDLDFTQMDMISSVAKALSSNTRLQILNLLKERPYNISEIAGQLKLPVSSTALHLKTLEDAGLIITQSLPGIRGAQRLCNLKVERVTFTLWSEAEVPGARNIMSESMPIGNYYDCCITAPCGAVSDTMYLSADDSHQGFYSAERHTAQLLWFTKGYLEYRFSNYRIKKIKELKSLEFSMELCSEAPGYNNHWKSDISFWINGTDLGFFTSEGDYGGRRGKLNPDWWNANLTQYGMLKTLSITNDGCFVDGSRISDVTLETLGLKTGDYLTFRLGVKAESKYVGGLNLFGEKFGDHPQNIIMRMIY